MKRRGAAHPKWKNYICRERERDREKRKLLQRNYVALNLWKRQPGGVIAFVYTTTTRQCQTRLHNQRKRTPIISPECQWLVADRKKKLGPYLLFTHAFLHHHHHPLENERERERESLRKIRPTEFFFKKETKSVGKILLPRHADRCKNIPPTLLPRS